MIALVTDNGPIKEDRPVDKVKRTKRKRLGGQGSFEGDSSVFSFCRCSIHYFPI